MLRNVYFGEVTDPDDFNGDARVDGTTVSDDAVYAGKLITDLTITKTFTEKPFPNCGCQQFVGCLPR